MSAQGPSGATPSAPVPRPGVGADETLAGWRLAGPGTTGGLDRFRLAPSVAGALRATIDCLLGDTPVTPVQVMADESALELRCSSVDPNGLLSAGGVIEMVEGSLAPTVDVPGGWSLRLPLLTRHETFLMIERGEWSLALPWHAVLRVRMVELAMLDSIARRDGVAVVSPLGLQTPTTTHAPVVMVGLGLRRAWVLADRLVWRMTAEPVDPPPTPPDPRLGPALRTSDARTFWLLDPAELLRDAPMPALPRVAGELAQALEELRSPMTPAPTVVPHAPADEEFASVLAPVAEEPSPAPIATAEDSSSAPAEAAAESSPTPAAADDTLPSEPAAVAEEPSPAPESAEEDELAPEPEHRVFAPLTPDRRPRLRLIELTPRDVVPFGDEFGLPTASLETRLPIEAMETPRTVAPSPPSDATEPPHASPPAALPPLERIETPPSWPEWNDVPPPAPMPVVSTRAPQPLPRVLVAEDSITACIFLERLLHQRGYMVRTVGSAADLRARLAEEPWALILADVDLPDAHGARWLAGLVAARESAGDAPLVALVRDDEDATLARAAGMRDVLRKPFERDELEHLLARLGLPVSAPRPD